MHGDWIVAVATIVGALVGILGTLIIEHVRKENQAVRFVISAPEDLAVALRSHGSSFELKVNNVITQTLIAAGVGIQNTGNIIIKDFAFDISVPGKHSFAQAQPASENPKLAAAICVEQTLNPIAGCEHEPYFTISVPFFNPKESFRIAVFFDGEPIRTKVSCRLPSVTIKTITEEDVQRKTIAVEELSAAIAKLAGLSGAAAITGFIAALIALGSH